MKKTVFQGTATALVTPFKRGKIDYRAFAALMEMQLAGGVDALVVNGTTGEGSTLSREERMENIEFVRRVSQGKLPIIAGTGCNCTDTALCLTRDAAFAGADAALVVTPYYNKTSEKGVIKYFFDIADNSEIPIIIYNVPSRTGMNLSPATVAKIASHDNIAGIKQSDGDLAKSAMIRSLTDEDFALYCGNDDLITPMLSIGAKGAVSVVSNAFPMLVSGICADYFSGNAFSATKAQITMAPLVERLFDSVNPIPIKALLAHMGIISNELRLPLVPLEREYRGKLFKAAEKIMEEKLCER